MQPKRAASPLAHARIRKPPARLGDEPEGPQHQTLMQRSGPGGDALPSVTGGRAWGEGGKWREVGRAHARCKGSCMVLDPPVRFGAWCIYIPNTTNRTLGTRGASTMTLGCSVAGQQWGAGTPG
jgi:hypothetical protein